MSSRMDQMARRIHAERAKISADIAACIAEHGQYCDSCGHDKWCDVEKVRRERDTLKADLAAARERADKAESLLSRVNAYITYGKIYAGFGPLWAEVARHVNAAATTTTTNA
jgi:hypothetical protein